MYRSLRRITALFMLLVTGGEILAAKDQQDIRFPRLAIFFLGHQRRWTMLFVGTAVFATQDRTDLATAAAREALHVAETVSGPDSLRVATSLRYLALMYARRGSYAKAEPLVRRALKIREQSLPENDQSVADEMVNLARICVKQQKLREAESLYLHARRIRELVRDRDRVPVADVLSDLGQVYSAQQRYGEAEQAYKEALDIKKEVLGNEDLDIAEILKAQASLHVSQGRYPEAEKLYKKALEIEKRQGLDENDPLLVPTLDDLATLYEKQGNVKSVECRQLASRIKDKALNFLPVRYQHKAWEKMVHDSIILFLNQEDGSGIADRALRFSEAYFGPSDWRVSIFLIFLASERQTSPGEYNKAESYYRRAMRIQEKALGTEDPAIAQSINELAGFYGREHRFSEEEVLLERAHTILEKMMGLETPEDPAMISHPVEQLAWLYEQRHNYSKAEMELESALQIVENSKGPEKPRNFATADLLSYLAALYQIQGDVSWAIRLVKRAAALHRKSWGFGWPSGVTKGYEASDLIYLAQLSLLQQGPSDPAEERERSFAFAELQYKKAARLLKNATVPQLDVKQGLVNLYVQQGKYEQAEGLLKDMIRREQEKDLQWNRMFTQRSLAEVLLTEGRYSDATDLLDNCKRISEAMDPQSLILASILSDKARALSGLHRIKEAQALFDQVFRILRSQSRDDFTYMDEADRITFLETVDRYIDTYFSVMERFQEEDCQIAGQMYDLVLWRKGLVLRSIESLWRRVRSDGGEALEWWKDLTVTKAVISSLMHNFEATGSAVTRDKIINLRAHAHDVEQKLVVKYKVLADTLGQENNSWTEVRDHLSALTADAAVEFVLYPFFDGKVWTGEHYAALVLTQQSQSPHFVVLGESSKLQGEPIQRYKQWVSLAGDTVANARSFYTAFWKPIEPFIDSMRDLPVAGDGAVIQVSVGGVPSEARRLTKVYIAPDGILNEVSLGVVPSGDDRLLMEKYDLRIVNSTADLLVPLKPSESMTAVLVGNPQFTMTESERRSASEALANKGIAAPSTVDSSESIMSSVIPSYEKQNELCLTSESDDEQYTLNGTSEEVWSIYELLKKDGWKVEPPYTGAHALKEVVKGVQHPRVLHLATHGFFVEDKVVTDTDRSSEKPPGWDDPMLRSGLYFADACRVWNHQPPLKGFDDGELTALEASGLDLTDSELVVLSGCKTGLGDVRAGEGVFGLRRALQQAGANSVLMSMWSVPDQETSKLMTEFYSNWLSDSASDKHEALRQAQLKVRESVRKRWHRDLPAYWGGFVLIGP